MQPEISIALLSSSNLQFFAGDLTRELRDTGLQSRLWVAGFNQYAQEIWNADSQLYAGNPDLVILHLDGQDLFADAVIAPFSPAGDPASLAAAAAARVEEFVCRIQEVRPDATVVLNTIHLPPVHAFSGLEHHSPNAISNLAPLYNVEIARISRSHPNVFVHDEAALVLRVGYDSWFDPRLWYLARCRLSRGAMRKLASSVAGLLRAWRGQTRKCVVLDLDNTLWGGILGEEGIEGVALGEEGLGMAFAEFQQELLNLTHKGILLALCSKNNEDDALAMIRRHPSMRLREEHFAARRINWQDKAQNIRQLAAELNLGLDSFVFIDDNPAERSRVRASLPEVVVPEWPEDPSHYKTALLDLACRHLMKISLTPEDQARAALYRSEARRRTLLATSGGLEEYYRSLEMKAVVGCADSFTIPRIAQLTQKTNQFNLTTRRYSEADIRIFSNSPRHIVLWMSVTDLFADNGIVGVLILQQNSPSAWEIDTLLLSCRVIGRTVERALLGHACRLLAGRGATLLTGIYSPTPKNSVCAGLYRELGFDPDAPSPAGVVTSWTLNPTLRQVQIPEWIDVEAVKETLQHA